MGAGPFVCPRSNCDQFAPSLRTCVSTGKHLPCRLPRDLGRATAKKVSRFTANGRYVLIGKSVAALLIPWSATGSDASTSHLFSLVSGSIGVPSTMTADQPLYNSRIINSYINLLKKKYQQVDVDELLHYAGIKPYEVTDEGHWFTQSQVDLFHDRTTQIIGTDISREAGRYAASADSLGLGTKHILGMIGPANAFHAIRKTSGSFSKSAIYQSTRLAGNKVEITVTPVEGAEEKEFQCLNRIGFFEAVLMLFDYDIPKVEHPECFFHGGSCCRYIVTWKNTLYTRLRSFRNYLSIPLLLLIMTLLLLHGWHSALLTALTGAFVLLICSYLAEQLEKKELSAALLNMKESSVNLIEQIEVNYNNARMINEVGQAISKQSDIDEVLENVVKALENRLDYDRCVILLADPQKSNLRFRTGFGYAEEHMAVLKATTFNLTDLSSKGVFVASFRNQKPVLINDFSKVASSHSARSVQFFEQMQAHSFICCPIVCEGESLGVLAVDNVKTKKKLVQSDMSLLMGIAPMIGVSIRNAIYIDRERRMAEQLRQSQKMEAVGQLAGGIAHDFNNLLTAIIGFSNLAEMVLEKEHQAQRYLEQVDAAAERATTLTQGLLAFSRKQVNDPQPIDLNDLITNLKKLLTRLISAEIELKIELAGERLQIFADSGQIDQVIMNLITNGRDAMSGSGTLTIQTSTFTMDEEFLKKQEYGALGEYALLLVTDTGTGMDDATKAHIFEPFFTTKEVGKGTGLGMAIVYGIVQQHEGYLDIESELGLGTTFKIYLPLLQEECTTCRQVEEFHESYQGTETVLVAEDAPEVRRLTREVLEQHGYQVIEAMDGEDALQKFCERGKDVDLVVMDVVMPKMNGKDVFGEILKTHPRMKVLFTSGYTPDDVQKKGVTFSKENFLPKPSSPQVLLKKVREILAA
jgi:signal transduction histidine kinase